MKILRTIGILAIVAALVLGGTASAFAKGPPDPHPGGGKHSPGKSGLFGTVESVESIEDYYVVELQTDQETFMVTINGDTKYKMPGAHGPKPDLTTFVDELPERRIAALVEFTGDNTANALRVMLIPIKQSVHGHRVGVVKEFIEDQSITIVNKKGEETKFEGMLDEIKLLPTSTTMANIVADETFITVIYSRDPATSNFVVKGIVVHPAIPDGWSKVDKKVEKLDLRESGVEYGDPSPEDPIAGFVILKADSDNDKIIIQVSLKAGEPNETYGVYLEDYEGIPGTEENWLDYTEVGDLETDEFGEGELETELARAPATYYVQIAVGSGWNFKTEVITLVIE